MRSVLKECGKLSWNRVCKCSSFIHHSFPGSCPWESFLALWSQTTSSCLSVVSEHRTRHSVLGYSRDPWFDSALWLGSLGQPGAPGTVLMMMITTAAVINDTKHSAQCLINVSVLVAQSCLTLCDPIDCSLPGSFVHGISQARIQSGGPFPTPGDLPKPRIESMSLVPPVLAGRFFTTNATWDTLRQQSYRKITTHTKRTCARLAAALFIICPNQK